MNSLPFDSPSLDAQTMGKSMYRYDILCRRPTYIYLAKRNVTDEISAWKAEQSDLNTITGQKYFITPVTAS